MEKKTVLKLHEGRAELKDYHVQRLIDDNRPIRIIFQGEAMTLSSEDLVNKKTSVSPPQKSKFGTVSYKLCGYDWNPDEMEL